MMHGMARFLVLLFLATLALFAVALISVLSAEDGEVRRLPRGLWIVVILVLPVVGPLLYFRLGRPARYADPWPVAAAQSRRPRTPAPDDDPAFLARLRGVPPPASGTAPSDRTAEDGRTAEDRPPTDG
jgi:hypothetical protein